MSRLLFVIIILFCGTVSAQGLPVGKVYKKPIYQQKVTYVRSSYPDWYLASRLRTKSAIIFHLMDEHSVQIPKELNLKELSYNDLYRLHAIIHAIEDGRMSKPKRLGYWVQKDNVYTFIWEL